MKDLILFGNGDFARLMKYYIENDYEKKIYAVTVEKEYINEAEFEGLPVVPFENIQDFYSPDKFEILVCVGYSKMNTVREKVCAKCREKGYALYSYIHKSCEIATNVKIGEGNIILEDVTIQPFVRIGDSNLIWHKVSISHDCVVGNYNTITSMSVVNGFAKIGNNCFIGSNACIRDKVNVADYSLIGAGVFANEDIEQYSVYVSDKAIKLDCSSMEVNI